MFVACLAALFLVAAQAHAQQVPENARQLIRQVNQAAGDKDLQRLRGWMARDFQWSFGGDADADQAIDAWRADPKYLSQLRRVTAQPCGFVARDVIQCPARGNAHFRAGFERTATGWYFRYFVEGD